MSCESHTRLCRPLSPAGMALGWLEKMLWFTPTHNITVASFGHDLGGSTYCGAYYLPTQVRPR
eukprot:COSAG04_NODE_27166_length_286_cov_0.545455_1_plen_62_part_10